MRRLQIGAIALVLTGLGAAIVLTIERQGPESAARRVDMTPAPPAPSVDLLVPPVAEFRSEPLSEPEAQRSIEGSGSISGVVHLSGNAPGERITLRLLEGWDFEGTLMAGASVASDGSFSFEGLAPGFEGLIRLPGRYSMAGSRPRERAIRVSAPSSGLLLDLERVPCLTGKLVSRATGEPVAEATLRATLRWDNLGQSLVDADVEPDGSFYVAVPESRAVAGAVFYARSPAGLRGQYSFTSEQIPSDLDLGSLPLDPGLVLHFLVLDSLRKPVAGARVASHGTNSNFTLTDSDGGATLAGIDSNARIEVLARGFDPISLELPATETTVEVVLARATRLSVLVLDPRGARIPDVRMLVRADEFLFVGSQGGPNAFLVPQVATQGAIAGRSGQGRRFFACFCTDDAGAVDLQSLVPGVAFDVSLRDDLETVVLEQSVAPLGPQEERELVLRLPSAPRTLAGIVEDPAGRPIEAAQVRLVSGSHAVVRPTDPAGRFRIERLFISQADLEVERRGYLKARLQRVPIQEGDELRVVLEPTRDVTVRVLDDLGNELQSGRLTATSPDGDREWQDDSMEDGYRHLLDLPFEELDVRLDLAGKEFHANLGARQLELSFFVAGLGRLEVTSAAGRTIPREIVAMQLNSLQDEEVSLMADFQPGSTVGVFDEVLAGSYQLVCLTKKFDKNGLFNLEPYGKPVSVEIVAGQTAQVELR